MICLFDIFLFDNHKKENLLWLILPSYKSNSNSQNVFIINNRSRT